MSNFESLSIYELLTNTKTSIKLMKQLDVDKLSKSTYYVNSKQVDFCQLETLQGKMVFDIFDRFLNIIATYSKTKDEDKLLEEIKKPLVLFYKPCQNDPLIIPYGIPKNSYWKNDLSFKIDYTGFSIRSIYENLNIRVIVYGLINNRK